MEKADCKPAHRNNRTICLPFLQEEYIANIYDTITFRTYVDDQVRLFPELFHPEIKNGYKMKDIMVSKKLR